MGRRFTVRLGAIIFAIGGAVQTCTTGYRSMCTGRIISGFGVGMLRCVDVDGITQRLTIPSALPCISDSLTLVSFELLQHDCPDLPIRNIPGFTSWSTRMHRIHRKHHRICVIDLDRLLLLILDKRLELADPTGHPVYRWIDPCGWNPGFSRITKVCLSPIFSGTMSDFWIFRYLIDTDQDDEGLRVIADFHDGNMDDPVTRAEFTEIKEAILADVCLNHLSA
jgi:hypothetical protein